MTRKDFISLALLTDTLDCIIWPFAVRKSSGYGAHNIRSHGRTVNHDAHRYVCALAHGEQRGMEAAHTCGNKLCINPAHLSWATHIENMADAKRHGTLRGGGRWRQRFFAADVASIQASNDSLAVLADRYNTDVPYISRIRRTANG